MKHNVSKEITSMDLNDKKTIASLQPNVSPRRWNLKLQANEINFEICSAQQYFKNPYRNPFQSSSLLSIHTFFCICCVIEIFLHCFKWLFLYFTEFYGHFPYLNLAKIRDTAPLTLLFCTVWSHVQYSLLCYSNHSRHYSAHQTCPKLPSQ